VDQSAFVDLMSRASDPKDADVIKDAIEAQTNKSISKTDFNKIYDRTQKTLTPGKLGKEAEWKSRTRKYVIDKIRPIDEEDTTYLEGRLEAANEFDTYLEEHPDVTSDIAKAQADAIIAKHIKSSNVDKRATLDMGILTVGRYQVTLKDVVDGSKKLIADHKAGTIDKAKFREEIAKLMPWKKLFDEEGKLGK
jgi:predicted  nucleic acid-binding Zn-ribbon protein